MLRIRLSRVGKRKQPSYRLVVADSHAPRDGAFIKIIGHYNPRTEPTTLVVKEDEAEKWLRRGAQPSETAAKLLTRLGVMERAGLAPVTWDRKTPVKPKKAAEEAPPAAVAATVTPEAKAPAAEAKAEAEAPAEEAKAEAETPADVAKAEAEPPAEEAKPEDEAPAEDAAAETEAPEKEEEEAEAEAEGEPADDDKATE